MLFEIASSEDQHPSGLVMEMSDRDDDRFFEVDGPKNDCFLQ